jgi:hypothetical protein
LNCLKYNPENRANLWAKKRRARVLAHGLVGLVGLVEFRAGAALQILNVELS